MALVSKKYLLRFLLLSFLCESVCLGEAYRPLDHLWYGTRDLPSTENIIILTAGTAATLAALSADKAMQSHFTSQDRLGFVADIGNFWGTGIPSSALGLGILLYGFHKNQKHEIETGEGYLEGQVGNAIYTHALKFTFQRKRPDGGDNLSFPSGHSSIAFTTAASLMDFYGPWVGVPALGLGTVTMLSRISANRHWFSDTVFGAALGYVIGHAYSQHHLANLDEDKDLKAQRISFSVLPYFETREDFGITASLKF